MDNKYLYEYEDSWMWSKSKKLKHIAELLHNKICRHHENADAQMLKHYDFSCDYLQELIEKDDKHHLVLKIMQEAAEGRKDILFIYRPPELNHSILDAHVVGEKMSAKCIYFKNFDDLKIMCKKLMDAVENKELMIDGLSIKCGGYDGSSEENLKAHLTCDHSQPCLYDHCSDIFCTKQCPRIGRI